MAETTVYECKVCHARAATPEDIEHQAVISHPDEYEVEEMTFPILDRPSPGLFGTQGGDR